ncbi:MAG: hypothetical protein ACREV6_12090 [Clostridium sp.]|uniref:hypothetical protein n=1 Tax=Clostridium sp. TaxID=1506 RepID=UPI003D6CB917
MKRFKNKHEDIYIDIFNKNDMDYLLQHGLQEEMFDVKMSATLREIIMKSTIKQPKSLYEKFYMFLNRTLEIPVSYVCTVCFVIFFCSTLSTFIVTDNMKTDKKLQGYTNIRVMNISGSSVILPKDISEVIQYYEN